MVSVGGGGSPFDVLLMLAVLLAALPVLLALVVLLVLVLSLDTGGLPVALLFLWAYRQTDTGLLNLIIRLINCSNLCEAFTSDVIVKLILSCEEDLDTEPGLLLFLLLIMTNWLIIDKHMNWSQTDDDDETEKKETYRAAHIIRDTVDRNTELGGLSRPHQTVSESGNSERSFWFKTHPVQCKMWTYDWA